MSKAIRIPRTSTLFVTGLDKIIREHFELDMIEVPHWEFIQVAEWTQCADPGKCATHGYSDQYTQFLDDNPQDISAHMRDCNFPYEMQVYLGSGSLRSRQGLVEVRVRIEETHNDAMGDMWEADVWIMVGNDDIQKAQFGFFEDGGFYHYDEPSSYRKPIPDTPPKRIAFRGEDKKVTV